MQRKYQLGLLALLFVGILAAGTLAMGFRGPGPGGHGLDNATMTAIQNDDYGAFTTALIAENKSVTINETQFNTLVARYKEGTARRDAMQKAQAAIKNNDFSAWTASMSTITKDSTTLTQERFNSLVQMEQGRQKIQQAIASNDFTSWKQAMTDSMNAQLTQDHFTKIVQAYQMRGNETGHKGAGFAGGMMGGFGGHGRGMGRGNGRFSLGNGPETSPVN